MTIARHNKQTNRAKTIGETCFERYLAENGLKWSSWGIPTGKQPDDLVHTSVGDVLCEIKDYGEGDLDTEVIKRAEVGMVSAGSFNPSYRSRNRIYKIVSSEQLLLGRGKYPTVGILHNPGYLPCDNHIAMLESLYVETPRSTNHDNNTEPYGLFRRPKLSYISAVAVLEIIMPNRHIRTKVEGQLYKQLKSEYSGTESFKEFGLRLLPRATELTAELEQTYGKDFLDREMCRLRIYHNPSAELPLPVDAFTGRYDVQIRDCKSGQVEEFITGKDCLAMSYINTSDDLEL